MNRRKWRSFEEARKFIRKLKLKSETEWRKYCKSGKKPLDIPYHPDRTYKKEWRNWGDWLGTKSVANQKRKFRLFSEARAYVRKLELKSKTQWMKYLKSKKLPKNIPTLPARTYQKEWINWGDWLGTGNVAPSNRKFRKFSESRKYVHKLKLSGQNEWQKFCKSGKLPLDIPSGPRHVYKKEWNNWGDWLGTGFVSTHIVGKNYLSLKEAKIEARKIKLELFGNRPIKLSEWIQAHKEGKIPKFLPRYPYDIFGNERKNEEEN